MKNYYVYLYLREKDKTPYYVGKGKGDRYKKLHRVNLPTNKENIVFVAENLTNEEACKIERQLITKYGRKDLGEGILHNQTNGGDGGDTSKSEGYIKWLKNVARNPESEYIKNISKRMKENNPLYNPDIVAKCHTQEARNKRGMARKGTKLKQEQKDKIRNSLLTKSAELSLQSKKNWQDDGFRNKTINSLKEAVINVKNMSEEEFYRWVEDKKLFTYSNGFKRPNSRVKLVIEHFNKVEEFYGDYYSEKESKKNKSWEYYKTCSEQEFRNWIIKQNLLRKDGNKNPRIFSVIKFRGLEKEFY